MALAAFERKAYYIATWKDDAVTDDIIKQIATLTSVEKGRKVKLKLGAGGLKITKSNRFASSRYLFDFIPLHDIFFMTVNQRHPMCLLCIIRDPHHKYTIVAFRCTSELIAGTFVQNFKALKRSAGQGGDNIELKKKDDGNWTLRERTTANAKRELQQLFDNPKPEPVPQVNGGVFYKKTEKRDVPKKNIYDLTPYVPSDSRVVYTETQTVDGRPLSTTVVRRDDDEMSHMSDMSSIKGEMEALSAELKEVKYLLEKSTGMSAQEHYRLAGIKQGQFNNNNESQAINYNQYVEPVVVIEDDESPKAVAKVDVPDYRSFNDQPARNSNISSGPEHLIAKSYRNSGDFQAQSESDKYRYRMHSGTNKDGVELRHPRNREPEYKVARHSSIEPEDGVVYAAQRDADVTTVEYPQSTLDSRHGSVSSSTYTGTSRSVVGRKVNSLKVQRLPASYGVIPSIVERPVEDVYSRPVIIRRDYIVGSVPRRRPNSMYVVRPKSVYGSQILTKESF